MRVRFAPSPTGQLHVGNARTALFNWLLARGSDGIFILRVEDTDAERSTRESEAAIVRDLRWLGLDWDEGPDVGGPCGPYRQSERLHLYQSYAKELLGAGSAYYCFCSTAQLEADRQAAVEDGRPVQYAGTCRHLSHEQVKMRIAAGEHPAIRFRVPDGSDVVFKDAVRGEVRFQGDVIGDPVILRADGTPAYNFAVVVDDALMEVTHVIRGEDHLSNTPRQILLYEALGFTPPQFAHLALVLGPDHSPLSKRHGATSVAEFRAKGYLPEALVNYLALHRLVAASAGRRALARRRRCRAAADRGAGSPFFPRPCGAQRRRLRRREAGVGQSPLSEDGRSRPDRAAVGAVFRRGGRADGARRSRHGVSGRGDGHGDVIGRSAQPGAGAAGVPLRFFDPSGRSTMRRSGRSWPAKGRAPWSPRWPRSWTVRHASIATRSGRSRIR